MIAVGILLVVGGYVMVVNGFSGDGSNPTSPTYNLGTAFKNAISGSFVHPNVVGNSGGSTG